MSSMKLMLGCISKEVPKAVKAFPNDAVAVIASYSQVGAGQVGYSGLDSKLLCQAVGVEYDVWRDHAHAVPNDLRRMSPVSLAKIDWRAGFTGYMPDFTPNGFVEDIIIQCPTLLFEAGHGEDSTPTADLTECVHVLSRLLSTRPITPEHVPRLAAVSAYMGTHLREGRNTLDLSLAKRAIDQLAPLRIPIRAHNCDWLSTDHLRRLRDLGVTEFNFAPEIAHYVMKKLLVKFQGFGEQLLMNSYNQGGFRRWGKHPIYGCHYVLQQTLHAAGGHSAPVKISPSEISRFIESELIEWINEKIDVLWEE